MVKIKRLIFLLIVVLSINVTCVTTSWADVFSIPNPPNSSDGVLRPTRGLSMDQVLSEFGQPDEEKSPVGKPPITRWIYKDFTVSFEGKWVIHSSAIRIK